MNRGLSLIYESLPVAARNALCTVDGYRRFRGRFGPHFRRTLEAWNASASDPIERQLKRQWEGLKRVMALAREQTAYYRFLPDPIEETLGSRRRRPSSRSRLWRRASTAPAPRTS